jgi:hypothetical protein
MSKKGRGETGVEKEWEEMEDWKKKWKRINAEQKEVCITVRDCSFILRQQRARKVIHANDNSKQTASIHTEIVKKMNVIIICDTKKSNH